MLRRRLDEVTGLLQRASVALTNFTLDKGMNHGQRGKDTAQSTVMGENEPDNFDILACTCIAFIATTLIVTGQMLNEGDLWAVAVIGGCMLCANIGLTRHHYLRLCRDGVDRENLPLTHSEPVARKGDIELEDAADRPNAVRFSHSSGHHDRHHRHHHRRDIEGPDLGDARHREARFQTSSSHRKVVRKARRKRKKESTVRQGGLAGLGAANRTICI